MFVYEYNWFCSGFSNLVLQMYDFDFQHQVDS